jgi:hypothetical protein
MRRTTKRSFRVEQQGRLFPTFLDFSARPAPVSQTHAEATNFSTGQNKNDARILGQMPGCLSGGVPGCHTADKIRESIERAAWWLVGMVDQCKISSLREAHCKKTPKL